MKSIKCPQCGFVGWADAERCKKCGVEHAAEPTGNPYQAPANQYSAQSPYQAYFHQQQLKKGLAIFSLTLGIANFFTLGFLGLGVIVGTVVSIVALSRIKKNPQVYGGKEYATAGLVTNIIFAVLFVPILAAIAIPNLLASRRAANEGAMIGVLRTLHSAEATYQATRGNGAYGTLAQLADAGGPLIDSDLASGTHYGYKFTIHVEPSGFDEPARFQVVGVPLTYGSSGLRSFYVDESGVIRAENNHGAEATELSPPLNTSGYSSSSPPSRRYNSRED
jgi:type II secretory pathway pseudopilin PulG